MQKPKIPTYTVADSAPGPADSTEFTDDDLQRAFAQIPFDINSLAEDGDDYA